MIYARSRLDTERLERALAELGRIASEPIEGGSEDAGGCPTEGKPLTGSVVAHGRSTRQCGGIRKLPASSEPLRPVSEDSHGSD